MPDRPLCACGCGQHLKRGATRYASRACANIANAAGRRAPDVDASLTVSGDTAVVTKATATHVRTLDDLVRVCEIDTDEWDIIEWSCKASQQASVPRATRPQPGSKWVRPSTDPVLTQMFHVSAKLRRRVALIEARTEIRALFADAAARMPKRPAIARPKATPDRDTMLELAIPDLHLGKLAWGRETGWQNYDRGLAVQAFTDAVETLLERTAAHRFARICLVVGNDFFHVDNDGNTTTGGTQLDADGRFQKTFVTGRRMVTDVIESLLMPHAPEVVVPVVPGNHDRRSAWHLGDSLACWFRNTKGVAIDNEPTLRKYLQFHRTMLLFTHGDNGKRANYPLLMAREQPRMWAETAHREAHTGHVHHTEVVEHMGVKVRTSPALCATDAWHASKHFVGNARAAEAFVWHKHDGLIATALYTLPDPE